jgi:hypothetical protein
LVAVDATISTRIAPGDRALLAGHESAGNPTGLRGGIHGGG